MPQQPKDARPDLHGQALHAMDRLHDHIERLDNGKVYATDDLAVALRLLVGKGRGLDLLKRIRKPGTNPIRVLVSRPPESSGTHFSFGLMPARDDTTSLGSSYLDLDDWLESTFLSIRLGGQQKNFTWERFISTYGNKWGGAHVDDKIPTELSIIDRYAFGGFSLSAYFLRTAGVLVWKAAQMTWAESRFTRSGKPLSTEELTTIRLSSAGIEADPTDRLGFGEPQFFSYRGDSIELLCLMSRHSSCTARLAAGPMTYNLKVEPADATHVNEAAVIEPRIPSTPALTAADFSLGRTLEARMRFIAAD